MGAGPPPIDADPEHIEFWTELPYNETGKLLRRELRVRLAGDDAIDDRQRDG